MKKSPVEKVLAQIQRLSLAEQDELIRRWPWVGPNTSGQLDPYDLVNAFWVGGNPWDVNSVIGDMTDEQVTRCLLERQLAQRRGPQTRRQATGRRNAMIRKFLARDMGAHTIHNIIATTEPELLRGRKKHSTDEPPLMSAQEMMRQFRRSRHID